VEIEELITGTGAEAKAGDTVTVNYVGVLYNGGAIFDSSWRRGKRFTFTLGTGQVIVGWNQGVSGMKVGGRRELVVPAAEAYGAKGLATRPVAIPPNAALVFVVDLLEVSPPPATTHSAAPTSPAPRASSGHTTPSSNIQERLSRLEVKYRESKSAKEKEIILEDEQHLRGGR